MMSSRRRRQSGLTLVELMIGMAVGSILLVGLTGVLFAATAVYNNWTDRIATSGTGDVLAAAIVADSHRYVACPAGTSELRFCYPHGVPATAAVVYRNSPRAPYSVTRIAGDVDARLLARSLPGPLQFRVACREENSVDSGFVSVVGLPSRSDFRVYFVSARGGCQGS